MAEDDKIVLWVDRLGNDALDVPDSHDWDYDEISGVLTIDGEAVAQLLGSPSLIDVTAAVSWG